MSVPPHRGGALRVTTPACTRPDWAPRRPSACDDAAVGSTGPPRLLVSLVGLPAAGKSSLARAVSASLPGAAVVVSFDDVASALGLLGPSPPLPPPDANGAAAAPAAAGLPALASARWRAGRAAGRAAAAAALSRLPPGGLLLVDDNAWLASMRRSLYALARDAPGPPVAYASLLLALPPAVAAARDAGRPPGARVGAETIERMAAALEAPTIDVDGGWEAPHAAVVDATAPLEELVVAVCEWLSSAPRRLPRARRDDAAVAAARAAARAATAASALHAAELSLRRRVGERLAAAPASERPALALALAARKATAVARVRELAAAGALPAPRGADDHAGGGRAGGGPPRGSGAPSVESDAPSDSEGEDDEGDDDGGAALEAAVDAAWHGAELAAAAAAGSALGAGADGARGDGVSTLSTAT